MSEKKKILIFADWYLPGYKAGGPVKSVSSIVKLLKNDFDFFIVTTNTDFGDEQPYSNIKPNIWIQLSSGENVMYLSKDNLSKKSILTVVESHSFDLFYCNSLFSFYFSIIPIWFHKTGKIKKSLLLAPRGMLGEGALKIKAKKKKAFITFFKMLNIHKLIIWHSTSEQETNEIKKHFGKNVKMHTVGNLQVIDDSDKANIISKEKDSVKFLFLSRISEKKNLLFALKALSEINSNEKNIVFDIVGPIEDEAYWNKCEQIIAGLKNNNVSVNYLGAKSSEKVREVYNNHHFFFLPTFNENYGHVIVESFLAARPVIISDQTPWRNLKNSNAGWDIALNDKNTFIKILQDCIEMPNDEFQKMCDGALRFAKDNCKFDEDRDKTKQMFLSAIEP